MDQEITTCPQCGATVQAPARFCVTCGIRLPETPASSEHSEPPDPRAGWASRDTSGWTTPPPGAFDFEDPTIIDVEPIPLTTEPPGSRWASWPSQPERTESPSEPQPAEVNASEDDYVVASTTAAPMTEQFETVTSETATPDPDDLIEVETEPSVFEPEAQPEGSGERESPEEPAGEITPVVEESPVVLEAVEEMIASPADVAPDEDLEEDLADDFEPAGWTEVETDVVPENEPVAPEEVFAATTLDQPASGNERSEAFGESDPIAVASGIDRANELLEELRALLPGLVREVPAPVAGESEPEIEEPAGPSIDLETIRAAAVEARGEISFDDFAALRATIDEATTRPRDVEVMLKLSQRVDDIVALMAERDRLQQAFDIMLERLNG